MGTTPEDTVLLYLVSRKSSTALTISTLLRTSLAGRMCIVTLLLRWIAQVCSVSRTQRRKRFKRPKLFSLRL
jgi:hypothetical protein